MTVRQETKNSLRESGSFLTTLPCGVRNPNSLFEREDQHDWVERTPEMVGCGAVVRQNTKFLAISPQEAVDFRAVQHSVKRFQFKSKLDDVSFRIRRRYNPNWT